MGAFISGYVTQNIELLNKVHSTTMVGGDMLPFMSQFFSVWLECHLIPASAFWSHPGNSLAKMGWGAHAEKFGFLTTSSGCISSIRRRSVWFNFSLTRVFICISVVLIQMEIIQFSLTASKHTELIKVLGVPNQQKQIPNINLQMSHSEFQVRKQELMEQLRVQYQIWLLQTEGNNYCLALLISWHQNYEQS